jgi:hypothetical protein
VVAATVGVAVVEMEKCFTGKRERERERELVQPPREVVECRAVM